MRAPQEQLLVGLAHVDAATTSLQRIRGADPTAGLWEAADRQWSWRNERSTDELLAGRTGTSSSPSASAEPLKI